MKQVIIPEGGAKPIAPYSPGILFDGRMLFTSGQLGVDPATGKLLDGVEAQARQALTNLVQVLEAGGAGLDTVLKITVFLANMDDFALVNGVYATFFQSEPPARSAIQVARLPLGGLIEIEAIAFVRAG